jgi:hypothetical protein
MDIDIDKASKDELARYAKEALGLELDLGQRIAKLREQVAEAQAKGASAKGAEPSAPVLAAFLKNPKTGRVFEATDYLRAVPELLACDAEGSPL